MSGIMSDPQLSGAETRQTVKAGRVSKWKILLLIGVVGLGTAAYQYHTKYGAAEKPVVESPMSNRPRQVKALGQVLPASNLVTIAGPTGQDAGRIARIAVADGDKVDVGQVLAVLDTEPLLKAQLDQAVADESVRRAALAVRIADLDALELQLRAQMDEQQVALQKAQLELNRRTRLRDTGLYEDAALADLRFGVQSAVLTLRNLEIQLDRTRLRTTDGVRLDQQSALSEVKSAAAARAKAEADYAKAFIRAPIIGRVLAVFGRVGQQIDNNGFGKIGDTSRMMIRAEVYETDMVDVFVGQPVTATSRAFASTLSGKVSRLGVRISGQSILSTDPAAVVDARVIEVWIALDDASSAAVADRSGLQVTAAFLPQGDDDV
jgi:HlyD family secretion protein